MSAPPAYSPAAGAGEGGNAPPPAYNASAPAQPPPAYNAGAPSQAPVQAQPAIKYVDQNGNPVAPPTGAAQPQQPAIKFVDQYGNPVAPPQQQQPIQAQPTVKYVDQYGNPVAPPTQQIQSQPTANIKFVDQYGNPVAPPVGAVQPQAQAKPQPVIKYVDQNGNPVAPPVGGAAVTTTTTTATTPGTVSANGKPAETPQQRQQRTGAAVMGMLASLLLFIGLCVDQLASDSAYGYDAHCGWTSFHGSAVDLAYGDSVSYGDLCSGSYGTYSYSWSDGDSSWCGTQAAAAISLVLMLGAFITDACATYFVQPWKEVNPFCCRNGKPVRTNFGVSIFLSLISIIAWTAGDDNCLTSGSSASLGGTHICQIIAMIFNFIALILARES